MTTNTNGFTLIETLLAFTIGAAILIPLSNVLFTILEAREDIVERTEILQAANFAMSTMVDAIQNSPQVLIPMVEDPGTMSIESIRDPGVIAVRLDSRLDRNLDGIADADNDGDGRIDEDLPSDISNDGVPGFIGIDDDNDGFTDVSLSGPGDDDETGWFGGAGEDPVNGIDDDGDAMVDEDPAADMNGDGAPGIALFDDDGDGSTDEGSTDDDDEDGSVDEDWLDAKLYYLSNSDLIERHPNLNPTDGNDFTEHVIAINVTGFRVQRMPRGDNRSDLYEITLTLDQGDAELTLQAAVRGQN